jgi:hypothetical protein
MSDLKSEDFYKRLKIQLEETTIWPSNYLYKFIVLTDPDKIRRIHQVFDNTGAVIDLKKSKNGKYTSVSITVNIENPDGVIQKYKEVGIIEGVISL